MAAHVTASTFIDRSKGRVFGFLKDADNHRKWSGGLQYISARGILQTGMTYDTTHVMLGREIKSANIVRGITADQSLEIQNISGPLQYHVTYSLIQNGRGTDVSCSINIDSRHAAFRLAVPLFEMMVEAQIERDLANLKEAAESEVVRGESV